MESQPLGDRSRPIVLLQNGFSVQEIIARGDAKMKELHHADELANDQRNDAGENGSRQVQTAATLASNKAEAAVQAYQLKYNLANIPGYVDPKDQDSVNRARILRRYKLYSFQPDEMNTFRALAEMHPDAMQFDPRLYQYGGLWIYPVGAR